MNKSTDSLRERLTAVEACVAERVEGTRLQIKDGMFNPSYGWHYRQLHVVREMKSCLERRPAIEVSLPDFMVIGAPRCASTWCKASLALNRRLLIAMGEPRYFSRNFASDAATYLNAIVRQRGNYKQFGHQRAEGVRQGEKNPDYMALPPEQVWFIKQLMPHLKIIVLVRDPVEAAWSNLKFELPKKGRNPTETSVETVARTIEIWKKLWSYSEGLPVWRGFFEDVLTVDFEDIGKDPRAEARRMFEFLGVADDVLDEDKVRQTINASNAVPVPEKFSRVLERAFADEYKNWERTFGKAPPRQPLS